MTVGKNCGPFRHHRLAKHARAHEDSSAREPFPDCAGNAFILNEAKPEQLCSDLTSDVITGWSQTAGNDEYVATAESLQERVANSGAIRYCRLSRNPQTELLFIGSDRGMEREIIGKAGFRVEEFSLQGLPTRPSFVAIKQAVQMLKAYRSIRRLISEWKPDVVVGTGGYVTVPGALAARAARVPRA